MGWRGRSLYVVVRELYAYTVPPSDSRTDAELIAAVDAGDEAAFSALYERYADWTLRVAFRFLRQREDALDVVQETFLYLLGRFPGFRLTARLTTYLYSVIRSLAITKLRRRRPATGGAGEDPLAAAAVDDAGLFAWAVDDDLAVLLAPLTDAQREIVLMRFVDDLSPDEIAEALKIPVGTAKSRLHGAVERLRASPAVRRYADEG